MLWKTKWTNADVNDASEDENNSFREVNDALEDEIETLEDKTDASGDENIGSARKE